MRYYDWLKGEAEIKKLISKYETTYGPPIVVKIQNVYDYLCTNFSSSVSSSGYINIPKEAPFPIPQFPVMFFEYKVINANGYENAGLYLVVKGKSKDQIKYDVCSFINNCVIAFMKDITFTLPDCECINHGELSVTDNFNLEVEDYFITECVFPALLAMSFMNCKNVQVAEHNPPDKVQRKREKNKKPPLTRYYTLEIEPMKKILKTEGKVDEVGLQRALHICRGHFKDYSNGKGLFGKYKGLYWWDSTIRGTSEAGIIEKDYSIAQIK